MIGNILLLFAALSLIGLIQVTASPMPGGDRAVGAAFMLFICGAGFALTTGLLALNLGWNHRFDWVPVAAELRNWLVFIGWLTFAVAVFATAIFKMEWHDGEFPQFLRWLAQARAVIWLPILMLVPVLLLPKNGETGAVSAVVKIPMAIGFCLSALIALGALFGWIRISAQQQAANAEYEQQRNDSQHQQHLDWIAQQKPTDPIVNILALTGRFHDTDVRDSAVAKVKSHPDWEAELIQLLNESDLHTEVYSFIDGNKVDHPELFVEPINRSIRRCAQSIKNDIPDSNNLQDWHFEHLSLERLFRAIDEQFMLPGADYRPAVLELRAALDTPKPERFAKVRFTVEKVVDGWLKGK